MKITIDVPEMSCAKCGDAAPIQPHLLYLKGNTPTRFQESFSALVKERPEASARDSEGRAWEIFTDSKPVGWMKGPGESNLCPSCSALWLETAKAFLAPPEEVKPKGKIVPVQAARTNSGGGVPKLR